jgi:hypothetical protein
MRKLHLLSTAAVLLACTLPAHAQVSVTVESATIHAVDVCLGTPPCPNGTVMYQITNHTPYNLRNMDVVCEALDRNGISLEKVSSHPDNSTIKSFGEGWGVSAFTATGIDHYRCKLTSLDRQ